MIENLQPIRKEVKNDACVCCSPVASVAGEALKITKCLQSLEVFQMLFLLYQFHQGILY